MKKTLGIHHISSIVGHPQENVDFYLGVLGLRLIKQTLNFDDMSSYHLYYGNDDAEVGTIPTFFSFNETKEGKIGIGQVGVQTFAIPEGSASFWKDRLIDFGVPFHTTKRFDCDYILLKDPHNLTIELVETSLGEKNKYEFNGITSEVAVKGIYSATLFPNGVVKTISMLESLFGYEVIIENEEYVRLKVNDRLGGLIDLKKTDFSKESYSGKGTVHHLAFIIEKNDQQYFLNLLQERGFKPTAIRDRKYFESIYFRDSNSGILFELATKTPGFLIDENHLTLGSIFHIPPRFEKYAKEINELIIPLEQNEIKELKKWHYTNRLEYFQHKEHKELLKRINELAKISKERSLTELELTERDELRKIYISNITYGVTNMVSRVRLVNHLGEEIPVKKKSEEKQ